MLNFINSKLPDKLAVLTNKIKFSKKSKSFKLSNTDIYIAKDLEFAIHVFYWCILLDHEI